MTLKILIVDDHPMMLTALAQAIAQQPNCEVVGMALTGELGLKLALELTPDLVVMEIRLPFMNGLAATRQILSALPATRIVIFSGDAAGKLVDEALQAGARGYICKRGSAGDLIRAIGEVMAGRLCLSPELSSAILEAHQKNLIGESGSSKQLLSKREKQLLRLVGEGRRTKEIAAQMKLSPNSIETYRTRLMKKIGCRGTAEMVRYAIREGIVAL